VNRPPDGASGGTAAWDVGSRRLGYDNDLIDHAITETYKRLTQREDEQQSELAAIQDKLIETRAARSNQPSSCRRFDHRQERWAKLLGAQTKR
jgi:hypothetical protein